MRIQIISQSLLCCALIGAPLNRAVSIEPLVELSAPTFNAGAVELTLNGPAGTFSILTSENLQDWTPLRAVTKSSDFVTFSDLRSQSPTARFYRAVQFVPPTNMVYIAPNTFVMGSPITELHRQTNEGPQTTVTLSRGYWIGKFEVTQGEYLGVTGTNPSFFPGDLTRPISSVSWPDATNYCALLTHRELAAGRIPVGYSYRLPTEAEWECAARAGTTTRFSYGDDPDYTELPNHAWFFMNGDLTVHPVGQKLPNPWGLYDMEGNVWEWTQDWLSDHLPGGAITDPLGAPNNPIGWKVIRGGGYDFGESDCRSAKRYFFGNHPALTDTNLGLRVVLAPDA
jgi:formylglycine-generating enzyme required for sulfatase activity